MPKSVPCILHPQVVVRFTDQDLPKSHSIRQSFLCSVRAMSCGGKSLTAKSISIRRTTKTWTIVNGTNLRSLDRFCCRKSLQHVPLFVVACLRIRTGKIFVLRVPGYCNPRDGMTLEERSMIYSLSERGECLKLCGVMLCCSSNKD